jgi:biotin/methionine sulfoxide reductase
MAPKLIPHACHWGAFQAKVEDGRLIGVVPFADDPAPTDLIEAWPEMVYSPQRVARPFVRRGYLAGDGGEARGVDDFVAVPWDEALDLAADALKRTRDRFGNAAISGGSYGWASAGRVHHAKSALKRFLNAFGGCTGQWSNYSYGAADALMPHVVGSREAMNTPVTEFSEIARNAKLVLAFGGIPAKNWEMQSGGSGIHGYKEHMRRLKDAGVEVITVSPWRGDMPEGIGGEWQPIRPNSDTALMLAMIRQIDRDGQAAEDFLARYTSGAEVVRDYVAGRRDGIERGPEWAAQLTGIAADKIVALTRRFYDQPSMLTATWSLQRAESGEQPFWALVTLAAMLGRIGLPGQGYAMGYGSMNGVGNPRYRTPLFGLPALKPAKDLPPIPVARIADLLLMGGQTYRFNGRDCIYPQIDLIYWAGGNPFHHHQDLKRLSQGFRKVSTVIVHENFWTATARHADIVLPATTSLEREDYSGSSRDGYILAMHRVIDPVGKARDDYDIFAALAERLGVADTFTEGRTSRQWLELCWEQTRAALEKAGTEAPEFEAFWANGYFKLPETEPYTQFTGFRADPERTPLDTPSGRIMLATSTITDGFGHPHWRPPEEWLGSPLAARHPFHLLSPQPSKRLHGQMENASVGRCEKVDGREKLRLSAQDAARLGLVRGDPVDVWNDRGSLIAVAWPEADLLAGVVLLPTGAQYDPDEAGNDRNSNPNVLIADRGTSEIGQGCAAQSCLVSIRKRQLPTPALTPYRPVAT